MKPIDKSDASQAVGNAAQKESEEAPAIIDPLKVEIEPLFQDFVDFDTFSKSDFRAVKVKECSAVPKSKKLLMYQYPMAYVR